MDILKAAFADSFIAQILLRPDGRIFKVNDQACTIFRCTREDLISREHREITLEEPEIFEGLADKFEKNRLQNWQTEQQYVRKDGSTWWASVSVSAVRENEKVEALLIQFHDITSQKRDEEDVRRIKEDLNQFVSIASHDLREPLTNVAGFATLLRKRYADHLDEIGLKFLDQIIDSAKRMEGKIDDLLAYSKAGRIPNQGTFPLGAAIDEARRLLVRCIEESKAELDLPSNMPLVQGDRSLVAQVFQNLFSNSIKYAGKQPPRIKVRAETYSQDENFWLISVEDNGIGFDMQHKDRIFAVFQRLYTVEQYPGTGIGLAIVKKIVEHHRGRIWTFSEPGKGSTFFFTLPKPQP